MRKKKKMTEINEKVQQVAATRREFYSAQAEVDALMDKVRSENQQMFDRLEKARTEMKKVDDETRDEIRLVYIDKGREGLPEEFGVRVSNVYEYSEIFRDWAFQNMPVLLVVDDKKAQAVLKTGLFKDAPAYENQKITPTISEKLGRE